MGRTLHLLIYNHGPYGWLFRPESDQLIREVVIADWEGPLPAAHDMLEVHLEGAWQIFRIMEISHRFTLTPEESGVCSASEKEVFVHVYPGKGFRDPYGIPEDEITYMSGIEVGQTKLDTP